jgi:DNA invertase Pin-like site-specific DNA recombinase
VTDADSPIRRCAIYTRKSSEEGLDQVFNSLDAQREACEAFIMSQRSEGWRPVTTRYDDGGWSGGNMDRPGLRQLLDDIADGRINTIVVYKIDRLTRSLSDFAKIVETLDRHNCSFVAVTQQFNTTTSMGRLTLNILLSFAQFEREVTGERIRDKIAASKRKGMWMGGGIPLGYDAKDRKLVINPPEAETVRHIFRRYLEIPNVRLLVRDLHKSGIRAKNLNRDGISEGVLISKGAVYHILSNPTYIGATRHKKVTYPGQHDPIIDRDLWDQVQQILARNSANHPNKHASSLSPLLGKLVDEKDVPLTPSHARKGNRRYRYYVSRNLVTGTVDLAPHGWRIPTNRIEKAVSDATISFLANSLRLAEVLNQSGVEPEHVPPILQRAQIVAQSYHASGVFSVIQKVGLRIDGLHLTLDLTQLSDGRRTIPSAITTFVPTRLQRRGIGMRIIIEGAPSAPVDPDAIRPIARGHRWLQLLISGEAQSTEDIAKREGISERYVRRLLPLATLAPDIIESILAGTQPAGLTAKSIVEHAQPPLEWAAQRQQLGFV